MSKRRVPPSSKEQQAVREAARNDAQNALTLYRAGRRNAGAKLWERCMAAWG
jgi:hypothetical protein